MVALNEPALKTSLVMRVMEQPTHPLHRELSEFVQQVREKKDMCSREGLFWLFCLAGI